MVAPLVAHAAAGVTRGMARKQLLRSKRQRLAIGKLNSRCFNSARFGGCRFSTRVFR